MTYWGRAYGLDLLSSQPIPGLAPAPPSPTSDAPALRVHWGERGPDASAGWEVFHHSSDVDDDGRPFFTLDRAVGEPRHFRMAYGDGTTFWIRLGDGGAPDEVWAVWPDDLTSEDTATYFLGPVLGYLLRMRGRVVLHASAVALAPGDAPSAGAVALVGPSGAGKSTTAAAFARRGHRVLTEDACALADPEGEDGPFRAVPGYPLVRLWGESVEMLFGASDALPLLTPTWDKRYLPLQGGAAYNETPLPLKAILLLEAREESPDAPRAVALPPAEAFIQLVANTYRNLVLNREERVIEFRVLHRLLRVTPVFRIVPHADPARLDALLDVILETATRASPPAP